MKDMKRYIRVLLLLPLVACSDWFDVVPDNENIPDKKFFGDENAFYNALVDVYTQLRSTDLYGGNLTLSMLEFMGQDLAPYDTPSSDLSRFRYDTPENSARIATVMQQMYRAIASCNKTLDEIEHTDVFFYNAGQKEIITGELYALRGALHFDLLRLFHPSVTQEPDFAGLPYMTQFGTETGAPQTSMQLLSHILDDLSQAATLLREYDPILSGWNYTNTSPGQIDNRLRTFFLNYYAVPALQARIYLYMGNYEMALERAQETFTHLQKVAAASQLFYYVVPGKYNSDFCFSREHIWGISSMPDGFTALSDTMFASRKIRVRSDLAAVFPDVNDTRFREWFTRQDDGSYTLQHKFGSSTLLSGYIYSTSGGESDLPARIPVIKLGEVALIAAEALNHDMRPDEAAEWLIELQSSKRSTLVEQLKTDGKISVETIAAAIRDEYQREFWGEGQRFFFHKRMGDTRIASYAGDSIDISNEQYTWPIPAGTISVNLQ